MLKFKLYYDKDEEEAWLKKMCLNESAFKKFFFGFYKFVPCKSGEYNYQIDLLDNLNDYKEDYSNFMEETGIKVVAQWWKWVYLQKKQQMGLLKCIRILIQKSLNTIKLGVFSG